MVRTKVFVGNLSFKTHEAELSQAFEAHAKVVSVNIITRGPRSLGYGFVELESEEDAKKAVAAMDKKDIDGRAINVEVAKIRAEGEERPPRTQSSPKPEGTGAPRRQRAPRAPKAEGQENNSSPRPPREPRAPRQPREQREPKEGDSPRQPRQPRQPRPPRQPKEAGEGQEAQPKPRRQRKPAAPKGENAEGATTPKQARAPRPKRDPNAPDTRVPSQTSLFVANLPFTLTNESFGQVFTDASLKFKKAHVVVKRNQKSKGFGFVEFETQEEQQKALNTLQGKKVEERELALKVALVDNKVDKKPEETPQSPAPAAPGTPTPTAAAPGTPTAATKTN